MEVMWWVIGSLTVVVRWLDGDTIACLQRCIDDIEASRWCKCVMTVVAKVRKRGGRGGVKEGEKKEKEDEEDELEVMDVDPTMRREEENEEKKEKKRENKKKSLIVYFINRFYQWSIYVDN